jgi:glycosyltransferase involved in cell wall biosynthesis
VPEAPRVSVIIPVYNCEKYVGDAIESVLAQTIGREAIDLLVLDDGSTDATPDVVRRFGSHVRFVQLRHGGVSAVRNTGVRMAYAPLIAFLDADDYWLPRRLEGILSLFDREKNIFANSDFYIEVDGERSASPYYLTRHVRCLFDLSAASQLEFALEDNFINSMVVAPRDAIIAAGGFNERLRYGEDWDLWLRLLNMGYAVRLWPEAGAVYRYQRPGSTTTRHDTGMAKDRLYVLSQYGDAVSPYRLKAARGILRRVQLREALRRVVPASPR